MNKGLLGGLLDLLFPPKCVFCHELLEDAEKERGVCVRCEAALRMMSVGFKGEFFERAVSCFVYEGNVRRSIHRFKFGGRKEYAAVYGRYLLARLESEPAMCAVDLVTFVPTNRTNVRKRGYQHAALLAGRVAEGLGRPCVELLVKTRKTRGMYGLQAGERRANILGAVKISCNAEQIRGKRVLIIDDIFTTGTTAGECSRVLRMAGAEKVFVLTVAKTDKTV